MNNIIQTFLIFLIVILLVLAYIIVRKSLKPVNPLQVAIPTMILIITFFELDNIIKNFLVKFIVTIAIYFVSYYLIKFYLERKTRYKV